ncbi:MULTISPECIES: 5'-3' exonuclease H3TH domain-containing protein [Oleiagrimonas]|uniref:Exodeoxyribonuclease IX n=1 Tax=Oleiagrimonas citrea TaxID=1665687 RepID=A0A846ZN39_9GAMM|nr:MULTISPECIES: 5'-3' exonuclease H3TH domain-containing protein [Oleiagrimonas]NKZ39715.1 exodeoxyribonuclease IX [Oleiagrimonas citrea]RAP59774.1 exodeoxyribonuclease IX [Oleiagrimonas sp. MCCC 1A03011]
MDAVNTAARRAAPAYLIDGSLYVFRAWHSMPDDFVDREGRPVNAVHGYTRFLCDLIERERPLHLMVAFDAALTTSFRNTLYPPYKANRELPPPDLERQFELCRAVTEAMGVTALAHHSYEADDLIGSMLWTLRAQGLDSIIVSADKDFGQLLGERDRQWDFARNRRWGPEGVQEKLGVQPHQVADYLALTGDAVDNIPGVPGVGAKTAAALLSHFGDLESLLERVDEVPYLRLRGAAACATRLREHAESARLFARITRIALDAPVPETAAELHRERCDAERLDELCDQLRFGPLTRSRLKALDGEPHA